MEFMFVQCFLPGGKCFSPGSFFQPVLPACPSSCKAPAQQQPRCSAPGFLQCPVPGQPPRPALADSASGDQGHVLFTSLQKNLAMTGQKVNAGVFCSSSLIYLRALPIPDGSDCPFSYKVWTYTTIPTGSLL